MEFFKICFLHSSPTQTTGGRDHSDIIKLFLEQFVNILKAVIVKIMHSSPPNFTPPLSCTCIFHCVTEFEGCNFITSGLCSDTG